MPNVVLWITATLVTVQRALLQKSCDLLRSNFAGEDDPNVDCWDALGINKMCAFIVADPEYEKLITQETSRKHIRSKASWNTV